MISLCVFQCHLLERKLNDEQLFIEFERIPKRKENAKYECALHEENKGRNSNPDYVPHDDNRVRVVPTKNNRQGYVNASYVTVSEKGPMGAQVLTKESK